ncbi:phytoene desaturase [Roseibium aquae]|uniref:Phytoene desaturase n=1 Tax=Roseibium aquae TaxID=1323746 RepID=A0A916T6L5_9HYPH|nr:1-hydroxycarotenoid 3,4-desaturase CrtD [Roseibium aquae]GGB33916.1 phytoene desaturase [Roseibium aquae]
MLTQSKPNRASGRIIVVGGGMGGLSAGLSLAADGHDVLILEKADAPGGKARLVPVGPVAVNGGPTVLTMKWVFDGLFQKAGRRLEDYAVLRPASLLARHFWPEGGRLDLFDDVERSAVEIESFSDARNAEGYRRFCTDSADVFGLLKDTFIDAPRPNMLDLVRRIGFSRPAAQLKLQPFKSLWSVLEGYFPDPRLRQLFGRYATYCGSSPFQAPATLMLVAHVEQAGGWRIEGGMHALAHALASCAREQGAEVRFGADVACIMTSGGRVSGVRLASGEELSARAVVFNGDVSALGLMLEDGAKAGVPAVPAKARSLSALAWCCHAEPAGAPLAYHTVFFNSSYRDEFDACFSRRRITAEPTVYICAQDRLADAPPPEGGRERLLCLINAPASGDFAYPDKGEIDQCLTATLAHLKQCGLTLDRDKMDCVATGPMQFHTLFPASGGAIYGPVTHGMTGAFNRHGARTRIKGLYLAGGTVHPGPGVPMAALSGKLAAECLVSDHASMR